MSVIVPSEECMVCDHRYRDHENGLFCMIPDCSCVEFISEEELFEDEEDTEFDEEEIENIFTLLKAVVFFSNEIRNSLRYLPEDELNNSVTSNVLAACYGIEKSTQTLGVYFDKDLPDATTIEKEFAERREFEKLLSL